MKKITFLISTGEKVFLFCGKILNMKKFYPLLFTALALGFTVAAQPSLTQSNQGAVVGQSFTYGQEFSFDVPDPGEAGANKTWDLTSIVTAGGTGTWLAPSSDPNSSHYPGATVTLQGYFFKVSSSKFEFMGVYSDAQTNLIYTNTEEQLHYPFTYGNTYSDTWAASGLSQGSPFTRTGTTTVTADGYGTLQLPNNTYNNALRVHFKEVYHDNVGLSYINDEYFWYVPGIHYYVASVYTLYTVFDDSPEDTFPQSARGYLLSGATGIGNTPPSLSEINLFPNPAASGASLVFNTLSGNEITVEVTTMLGQVVSTQTQAVQPGKNEITISTADMADGFYLVMTRNREGILMDSRRLMVKK